MAEVPYCFVTSLRLILAAATCVALTGCRPSQAHEAPSIEFTRVPEAAEGTPQKLVEIAGRVKGTQPGQRIVLFALSGVWWVQPLGVQPFTAIQADSAWQNNTHPGAYYAALLVDSRYRPPLTMDALPERGGPVLAVATVRGAPPTSPPATLRFSGYQWEIRQTARATERSQNLYDPANAWTDQKGFLHMRISRQNDQWASAEVKLSRSLGYGSYRFVVQDVSHLEPSAVFAMFTWDDLGPSREMDIEVSQWGEPEDKNGQFVVQPFMVPANTVRFGLPRGTTTYWMKWEPGRVEFQTARGAESTMGRNVLAEHVFTSGVPAAGNERIRTNHYVYDNDRNPLQHESEIVIEKFEYLP